MEYRNNPCQKEKDPKIVEIQSMLNKALDNAVLLVKADSSLPTMLGDPHYFQTLHHRNYIPNGWSKINPDGYFGSITENAVKCFQEFLYITSNGIIGETTYFFLSQLSSINYSSINVLGASIKPKHNKTNNEHDDFIERWKTAISKTGEDTADRIKGIIEDMCKSIISKETSSGNSFPVVVYQIRNVLSTNFSTLQQAAFLDNIRNNNYNRSYLSLNKATIPINNKYFSQQSLKIRIGNMRITDNIDKCGKHVGLFATVLLALQEPLKMLLKYEETESWYDSYEKEYYKAMDNLFFGGFAATIVRLICASLTALSTATGTTTGAATGAGVGAFGAGVGAIPGAGIGALGGTGIGLVSGIAITFACFELIKILVMSLITSLLALALSLFYAFISKDDQRLSQKILDPIFDNTVVLLMKINRQ